MKNLPVRIISAVVALALLLSSHYFAGLTGITVFAVALCTIAIFEYSRLVLSASPRALRRWFEAICFLLMLSALYTPFFTAGIWGALVAIYLSGSLWIVRRLNDNTALLANLAGSSLGFLYCGLLPMLALRLLHHSAGDKWFIFLFFITFAGDIFAYFGGILFGRKKLMPQISPNKTVAGAVFGAIGSTACGMLVGSWGLPFVPVWILFGISLVGALLAQNGDLFESLLKRVASVKDSGRIMPGHGGVLDRLDGIYFSAPFVYCAATFLTP